MDHDADPSPKDCRGRGALYWACLRGAEGRDILVRDEILPRLAKDEGLSICGGELSFHTTTSLTSETAAANQEAILKILLQSGAKLDLAERDDDGWIAAYTATRFGMAAVEESLAQAMILLRC
ncbi:hypothetical protein B0T25DRAFT_569837 [Lasiosphaeria hispida]|uniref:Ankyrin n=1 Tax=Lasiosphaeria hispida TaxID=260671 RepID=A0AAJ0HE81_9PEZI|nr:hypothetical protein B0T25DRAFT_569837 [Lasiosphaeria hispida]